MEFFFFAALVSFFLFAPIVSRNRFQIIVEANKALHAVVQVLIGLTIAAIFPIAVLTSFPEFFVGDSVIGSVEAVRVLLGVYFGCTCRFLLHYLVGDRDRMFPPSPQSDREGSSFRSTCLVYVKSCAPFLANWPMFVMTMVFLIALLVPHTDRAISRMSYFKLGGLEVAIASESVSTFQVVETLILREEREDYLDRALPNIELLLPALLRDRELYLVVEGNTQDRRLPDWLRHNQPDNGVEALLDNSETFLTMILRPYAQCIGLFESSKIDRGSMRDAVAPVSLALERFLRGENGSLDDVVAKMEASADYLGGLVVSPAQCDIPRTEDLPEEMKTVSYRNNVGASYYPHLCIAFLRVFQGNIPGAIHYLKKFEYKFINEPNYWYARGYAAYVNDEAVDETFDLAKEARNAAAERIAALKEVVENKRSVGPIPEDWKGSYENQIQRHRRFIMFTENNAAYEVVRTLAADQPIARERKSSAKIYLRNLEIYLNEDLAKAENKADKLLRAALTDTVGLGIVVFGYYEGTLDESRAEQALRYLRESEELAYDLEWKTLKKKSHNHRRFSERMVGASLGLEDQR